MAWLTKSRFLAGLQCEKRLWFEVHAPLEAAPPEATPPESAAVLHGRAVDELVRRLKPGTLISREHGLPAAIADTAALIRSGAPAVIHQPAFQAGDLAVVADVLETGDFGVTLSEVKSSTGLKPEHLADVAFQVLVIRLAGLAVDRVLLKHIDRSFELRTAGDYAGLLVDEDLTVDVEQCLPAVQAVATRLLEIMATTACPTIALGEHCTAPHACPFMERCSAAGGIRPDYPVTLLPRGGRTVQSLRAEGYEDLAQVPAGRLAGRLHRRVHEATLTGLPYFDVSATTALRALRYPLAYLDFETIGLAVPEFIGTHPYEQWPFQWSLHVEESAQAVRHAEFLALERLGELQPLAGALLEAVPESGPVFAYNAAFERGVLERMAQRLPAVANALRDLAARLVDLLPIARAAYYHRDMKGSWSIKAVLPTIAPELDYARLAEVRDGDAAQRAFLEIRGAGCSASRREALREALLRYCERDTWGLVVLRRFLSGHEAQRRQA